MPGHSVDMDTTTAPVVRSALRRWISIAGLLLGTIVLVWAGAWWQARAASAQIRSLAILPFIDLTAGHDDWFAASFTGEVIDELAGVPGLHVAGRTSAFRVKGDAGKQLGVAATIEGSIARHGDRLQVALAMTRTADGYRLWSTDFERPAGDPRRAVEDIAAVIARRLRVRLPAPPARRHLPSSQAYAAYLQGRYWFDQGSPEALNRAQEELEKATGIDPDFVPAWAWLSIVREYRVAAGMARPNRAMPASRDAAERAAALDPAAGVAHLALGIVKLQYDWDWTGAKEELDRAAQAMPESAFVLAWRARWFQSQQRMVEAIAETARALALDPLSAAIAGDAAREYVSMNQPERAVPFAQKAVDLSPDDPAARAALANILWLAGEKDKASEIVAGLRNSGSAAKAPAPLLASLEARMGEPEDARQLLDAAEDLPDDELLPAVEYAGLAAVLEDWDRVFSWTEEAYGERDVALPYWPESPLAPKSDPRFDAFLAQMNLPAPEVR